VQISQSTKELSSLYDIQDEACPPYWFSQTYTLYHISPLAIEISPLYQIWCRKFDRILIYAPKRNSKWRPPPSWIHFWWLFCTATYCRNSTIDLNHRTKYCASISVHERIIISFWNKRWRPSAILDFRKPHYSPIYSRLLTFHHSTKFGATILIAAEIIAQKLNSKWRLPPCWIYFWLTYCWSQPPYKISWKCLNPQLNYINFLKFKMPAVRHVGLSKRFIETWLLIPVSPYMGRNAVLMWRQFCTEVHVSRMCRYQLASSGVKKDGSLW